MIGELLFLFSEWLRGPQIVEFSLWVGELPMSIWIGSHFFAIPVLQTLHILAIAAAFGAVLMINFRILGLSGEGQPLEQAASLSVRTGAVGIIAMWCVIIFAGRWIAYAPV